MRWLVALALVSAQDAFSRFDENQNGVLEREEFATYTESLSNPLRPFLDVDANPRAPPKTTFVSAFMSSLLSIWATEIGDKTFFIAAILSMRNDRSVVFAGAIAALIVMTVLSVLLGGVVGYFLPKELTHYAGALLFVFFGIRMLIDARNMQDKPSEELAEVEEELEQKKAQDGN